MLRIRDWAAHFENCETKRYRGALRWVALPTKHDGLTFRRLMLRDPTGSTYGIWTLLVTVAAKCNPRGTLCDGDDRALDAEDLALKTGASPESIQAAVSRLLDIGWLEMVDADLRQTCGRPAADLRQTCGKPVANLPPTEHNITEQLIAPNGACASPNLGDLPPGGASSQGEGVQADAGAQGASGDDLEAAVTQDYRRNGPSLRGCWLTYSQGVLEADPKLAAAVWKRVICRGDGKPSPLKLGVALRTLHEEPNHANPLARMLGILKPGNGSLSHESWESYEEEAVRLLDKWQAHVDEEVERLRQEAIRQHRLGAAEVER